MPSVLVESDVAGAAASGVTSNAVCQRQAQGIMDTADRNVGASPEPGMHPANTCTVTIKSTILGNQH